MNRTPEPCSACARFRKGRCTGYEKPRQADDTNEACPLWNRAQAQTKATRARAQQPQQR